MTKILFVCLGNICRSPMAQFVMQELVRREGLADQFQIESAATSREEIGNPPHHGTRRKLAQMGIPMEQHRARQMTAADYQEYDLLIGMEKWNLQAMQRIAGGDPDHKMHLLLDFTERGGDIADPWYTGNFDVTFEDVWEGCQGLLQYLRENPAE